MRQSIESMLGRLAPQATMERWVNYDKARIVVRTDSSRLIDRLVSLLLPSIELRDHGKDPCARIWLHTDADPDSLLSLLHERPSREINLLGRFHEVGLEWSVDGYRIVENQYSGNVFVVEHEGRSVHAISRTDALDG